MATEQRCNIVFDKLDEMTDQEQDGQPLVAEVEQLADELANDAFFFAEDVFGGQFCARRDGIYSFEPEAGQFGHRSQR